MVSRLLKKRWIRWLLAFAIWTLIGIAFAGQLYLSRSKIGDPVTWSFAMGRALADWYVFALLSIPALWLGRRFSLGDVPWLRNIAAHFVTSALFSLFWMALRAGVEVWLSRESGSVTFAAAFDRT